jgi:hypothetical protein
MLVLLMQRLLQNAQRVIGDKNYTKLSLEYGSGRWLLRVIGTPKSTREVDRSYTSKDPCDALLTAIEEYSRREPRSS